MDYISTGFTQIDRLLDGGLRRSDLTVLTSTVTAMGKTLLATSILRHNLLEQDTSAMLFTLESNVNDVMIKLVSMESGVDSQLIRRGTLSDHEHQKIQFTLRKMENEHRLWIHEHIIQSVDQIRTQMEGESVDVVVVDYIELINAANNNYVQVLVDLTKLAKDFNVAVLAVAQIHNFRLSQGAIESIAKSLLILEREDLSELAEVTVRRGRKALGVAPLYFYAPTTRFFNSPEEYQLTYHGAVEGQ